MLALRCKSRRSRTSAFTQGAPTEWQPTSLRDPRDPDGGYFTPDGAWQFVAEALEAGHPIELITLTQPPGKKGFVLIVPGVAPVREIYIKLQLGSDLVIGRSFHESKS